MERLFFVGIKHSGKTTFARRIAGRFGYSFHDADDLMLSSLQGLSVRQFYIEYGKDEFMRKEAESVRDLLSSSSESIVLSLGGGAADNAMLMDLLKESGSIIYLVRKEEDMLPVILRHGIPAFLDKDDLEGSFSRVYARRDRAYRQYADHVIDLGPYRDKDETEIELYEALKELGYGR